MKAKRIIKRILCIIYTKSNNIITKNYINYTVGKISDIEPIYSTDDRHNIRLDYYNITINYDIKPPSEIIHMFSFNKKGNYYQISYPSYMIDKYSKDKYELEVYSSSKKFNL